MKCFFFWVGEKNVLNKVTKDTLMLFQRNMHKIHCAIIKLLHFSAESESINWNDQTTKEVINKISGFCVDVRIYQYQEYQPLSP